MRLKATDNRPSSLARKKELFFLLLFLFISPPSFMHKRFPIRCFYGCRRINDNMQFFGISTVGTRAAGSNKVCVALSFGPKERDGFFAGDTPAINHCSAIILANIVELRIDERRVQNNGITLERRNSGFPMLSYTTNVTISESAYVGGGRCCRSFICHS